MAEREQYLNADEASQQERAEHWAGQEGSRRNTNKANQTSRAADQQVAERNQEYREADQNAPTTNSNQPAATDQDTGWQLHAQQVAGTQAGGEAKATAGTQGGQMGGEGGSTSRTSEAPGGSNSHSTGQ